MNDLIYLEQFVNDRYGTSEPPLFFRNLLPEKSVSHKLTWARVKPRDAQVFLDNSQVADHYNRMLRVGDHVMVPIHPLEVKRWPAESIVESGTILVSASYRTVFFKAEKGGVLANAENPDQYLMMKLHLEKPLPGVPGDRRLTQAKIQKCVMLSSVLQSEIRSSPLGEQCEIVPEFLGISCKTGGVLFRRLPKFGLMPLFSMFSQDLRQKEEAPYILKRMRAFYGNNTTRAAKNLGVDLARPLLRSLFSGFVRGFSMEMHAQNLLFRPGVNSLIDKVYFRDLEGVVFSSRFRRSRGLPALFRYVDNEELDTSSPSMTRWYNRNVDHDIGRVFGASLNALVSSGYFRARELRIALRSIKSTTRDCVREAGLEHLDAAGRYLPISRSPYGNGLSKGHYYRTRYR